MQKNLNIYELSNTFVIAISSFENLENSLTYFGKYHEENQSQTLIDLGKIKNNIGELAKEYLGNGEHKEEIESIIKNYEEINNNMRIFNESMLVRHAALFESFFKQLSFVIQKVENERIAPYDKKYSKHIELETILDYIKSLTGIDIKGRKFWGFYKVIRNLRHTIAHGEHIIEIDDKSIAKLKEYLKEELIVAKEQRQLFDIGDPIFHNYISDDIKLQYKLNKLFIAEVKTLSKLFWNKYEPEETLGIQSAFAKT